MFEGFLTIDEGSKIPKYQQVVDTIVSDIELGIVKVGDKIPSINETSEEYYLSRDTVEKAYKILRKRGIITAVRNLKARDKEMLFSSIDHSCCCNWKRIRSCNFPAAVSGSCKKQRDCLVHPGERDLLRMSKNLRA